MYENVHGTIRASDCPSERVERLLEEGLAGENLGWATGIMGSHRLGSVGKRRWARLLPWRPSPGDGARDFAKEPAGERPKPAREKAVGEPFIIRSGKATRRVVGFVVAKSCISGALAFALTVLAFPSGDSTEPVNRETYCGRLIVAGQSLADGQDAHRCDTTPVIALLEDAAGESLYIQAVSYPPLAQLPLYDLDADLRQNLAVKRTYSWPCTGSGSGGPAGQTSGASCAYAWNDRGKVPEGRYDLRATYGGLPEGVETWAWGVMACLGTSSDCLWLPHIQTWCRELLALAGDPDPASSCAPAK